VITAINRAPLVIERQTGYKHEGGIRSLNEAVRWAGVVFEAQINR
jgi:hypothetical protein